jgi:predicted phosphodiesterase
MATSKVSPTKDEILSDFRAAHTNNLSGKATSRDYYEKHSALAYRAYLMFWPSFKEFSAEALAGAQSETQTVTGNLWSITLPKARISTLPELIKKFEVDESIWECVKFQAVSHEMGYTTGEQAAKVGKYLPLFNLRADFKKKVSTVLAKQEIEELIALAKDQIKVVPARQQVYREQSMAGNMLEINIPDVHFAKMSWSGETGHENYDTKIAEVIYDRAIDGLLFRAKAYRYDEVLFIVGNDLLQADDTENRTTSGTVVTTDGRYHKSFRVARRAVIKAIEKCRSIAPVKVIVVPGNHDELSSWHLGESLAIYFDRYDDVTVENEPTPRKYHQFGKVGLMLCHGHQGKRADYPLQFATERPDIFGSTKYREVHTGHTHQTKLDEQHGVRVRVLPALCPPDDWHSSNGFTGNLRSAEAYVWNREEGLVAQFFFNDDAQPPVNTKYTVEIG